MIHLTILLLSACFIVCVTATPASTDLSWPGGNHTLYKDRDPEVIHLFTDTSCPGGKYVSYRLSAKNNNGCYELDKPDASPFYAARLLYAGDIYGGGSCSTASRPNLKACWTLPNKKPITGFTIVPIHRADGGGQERDGTLQVGSGE